MFDFHSVPLPDYSRKEDIINSVTHAIGVPISIIGAAILIAVRMKNNGTVIEIASGYIYGISMIIVFLGSAIYHGLKPSYAKQVARVIDHCNVLVVIAGSVTALFMAEVYELNGRLSVTASIIIAVASVIGIFFTLMDQEKFKVPQYILYLVLGFSGLIGYRVLRNSGNAKIYLLYLYIGSSIMLLGAILYLVGKKKRYFHAVFHVCMVLGVIFHIIGTYLHITLEK